VFEGVSVAARGGTSSITTERPGERSEVGGRQNFALRRSPEENPGGPNVIMRQKRVVGEGPSPGASVSRKGTLPEDEGKRKRQGANSNRLRESRDIIRHVQSGWRGRLLHGTEGPDDVESQEEQNRSTGDKTNSSERDRRDFKKKRHSLVKNG